MDAEKANNWLQVWIGEKHPSFEWCTINTSDNIRQQMNNVMNEIVQNAMTTDDLIIAGVSTMLDAENKENAEIINGTNGTSSPCTIHTVS